MCALKACRILRSIESDWQNIHHSTHRAHQHHIQRCQRECRARHQRQILKHNQIFLLCPTHYTYFVSLLNSPQKPVRWLWLMGIILKNTQNTLTVGHDRCQMLIRHFKAKRQRRPKGYSLHIDLKIKCNLLIKKSLARASSTSEKLNCLQNATGHGENLPKGPSRVNDSIETHSRHNNP